MALFRLFPRAETRGGRFLQDVGYGAGALTLVAVLSSCGSTGGGEATASTSVAAEASAAPQGSSGIGGPAASPTPSPTKTTTTELVDNHRGALVFSDNRGSAVPAGVPGWLEYGTSVEVKCYEPNKTDMAGTTAFYVIEQEGALNGMRVISDVMTNGLPLGPNAVNLDPAVPEC